MNSTDFVDDISITFLYVSSSDLVLKIINSKNYHFARYKNITNKNAEENVRFLDMPPSCESIKMTHTKIRTVRIRHIVCSAIVLVGCNCSVGLFPCSYLEEIQYPQDIFSVSIFVPFL